MQYGDAMRCRRKSYVLRFSVEESLNQVSRNVALWLVLGLMVLLLFNLLNRQEARDPEIIFSEFLTAVEKGEVSEVTIQGPNIRGTTRTAKDSRPSRRRIRISSSCCATRV